MRERLAAIFFAFAGAGVSACPGSDANGGSPPAPPGGDLLVADAPASLPGIAAAALLQDSWMRAAALEPTAVQALLDAPGGGGWLHLYHGDLAAAEREFLAASPWESPAETASARLGLAQVHVARASAALAAWRLQRDLARELVRWRTEHPEQARRGPHSEILAALIVARAAEPPQPDPREALSLRAAGTSAWAARLDYVAAVSRGELDAASRLLAGIPLSEPDLRDPLGADSEAGLVFEDLYWDAGFLRARAQHALLLAWSLASQLPGGSAALMPALQGAGVEVPATLAPAPLPAPPAAASVPPPWAASFLSPALDGRDLSRLWGSPATVAAVAGASGSSSAASPAPAADPEQVESWLRDETGWEQVIEAALVAGAPPDGAALVQDLGFARRATDRLLRARSADLLAAAAPVLAKRVLERSLDDTPGSRGGAADSARTRVSWRNDRAFLLLLAHAAWRAGQPGTALELVHPLAEEDASLQPVRHYLGQLDAASSLGAQGKVSQLR